MSNYLTHDAESGTRVEVQSAEIPENFYVGVVDEEGRVMQESNRAIFNGEHYNVVDELEGPPGGDSDG